MRRSVWVASAAFSLWAVARIHAAAIGVWGWVPPAYASVLTNPPTGTSNVVAVAAGGGHCLALTAEGRVFAWGFDFGGEGVTNVPPGLSNVVAISAAGSNNVALTADGRVVGWGAEGPYSNCGQTTAPSHLTNVVSVAAGYAHTLALLSDGTVVGWGCGVGTNIPAGLSNVIAIRAAKYWSHALLSDGRVMTWGYAQYGAPIPTDLTNVVAVSANYFANISLSRDEKVRVWGMCCGDDSLTNVPIQLSNVVAVAASGRSCMAAQRNGNVVQWYGGQSYARDELKNAVFLAGGEVPVIGLLVPFEERVEWRLPMPQRTNNQIAIDLPTQRGRTYVVELTANLTAGEWRVYRLVAGDGTVQRLPLATTNQAFYRARELF